MNNQAKVNPRIPAPYLFEYYNIHGYSQLKSSSVKHVMGRIINSLAEALNIRGKLPRFITVIIDHDMIQDINVFDRDAKFSIYNTVNWLVKQIDIMIRRRRLDFLKRKPSAAFEDDPKIIYVRMLRKMAHYREGSKLESICCLRSKFNSALNDAALKYRHRILSTESCNSPDQFDRQGMLTVKGKLNFWHKLDELLERFDKKKIKLEPQVHGKNKSSTNKQAKPQNKGYKQYG